MITQVRNSQSRSVTKPSSDHDYSADLETTSLRFFNSSVVIARKILTPRLSTANNGTASAGKHVTAGKLISSTGGILISPTGRI